MTEEQLKEMVMNKCAARADEIVATLKAFTTAPGAKTCHDSEVQLHALLRLLGDDIFGPVITEIAEDPAVTVAALGQSKKNS